MRLCRRCNEDMKYIGSKQNGPYFVCDSCGDIHIPSEFGLGDNELDYISDRGRN